MIEFRRFGLREHQPHAAAIEKGHLRRAEQMLHFTLVAVAGHGAIEVVNDDRALADALQGNVVRYIRTSITDYRWDSLYSAPEHQQDRPGDSGLDEIPSVS